MQKLILLTGGSGMVGRNLLELALAQSIQIVAPSSKEMNLLSYANTLDYVKRLKPDFIIHAAGRVGGIQANLEKPVEYLVENWDMGRNIVLAAREVGVLNLLNLGSSCIYPKNISGLLQEEHVLTGMLEPTNEGYAIAKSSIIKLCQYIHQCKPECQYKTFIPCNLYGAYDKFDPAVSHLVPAIIHKLHLAKSYNQTEVDIWGDGTARREFLFAKDLAQAMLRALEHFESLPPVTNIGVGVDITVKDYYSAVATVVGYAGTFFFDSSKPVGMQQKLLDVSKATHWGFKASTTLEEGLQLTYDHYLSASV